MRIREWDITEVGTQVSVRMSVRSRYDMAPAPHVLVVEDEWLIATRIEEELKEAGFEVIGPVPSVARAIQAIEERRVDIAVLDIRLGGENSFPVAAALAGRGISFVFLSGYAVNDLPPTFADCRLLRKPLDIEILVPALEDALRGC